MFQKHQQENFSNIVKVILVKQIMHIDLPNTKAEFDSQLSKRVRYNTKWHPKKIKDEICDYKIECFDVKDKTQQENICNIFKCFFEWKKKTHNKIYKQTPNEYIKQFSITHCYSLSLIKQTRCVLLVLL